MTRALGRPTALAPASTDASFRSYWRTGPIGATGRTLILMDAPPDREDIRPWIDVGSRLRSAGIAAPEVLAADAVQGFVLMGDLGATLYLDQLRDDPATADRLYGAALDALVTMQTEVPVRGLPRYNDARLAAELDLLPTWFLDRHLGVAANCEGLELFEATATALIAACNEQPRVFVHRDYHSRNLLELSPAGGNATPGVLDFQDAVCGPVAYDVVSLLRDCYIVWPQTQIAAWLEAYRQRLGGAGLDLAPSDLKRWFDLTGLQRHMKVLGIFARLNYRDDKPGYLADLPTVWNYVREVGQNYPETRAFVSWLSGQIADRELSRPLDEPCAH